MRPKAVVVSCVVLGLATSVALGLDWLYALLYLLLSAVLFLIVFGATVAFLTRHSKIPKAASFRHNRSWKVQRNIMALIETTSSASPISSHGATSDDALQEALAEVVQLLSRDYVDFWYADLSASDPNFPAASREVMHHVISNLTALLKNVDVFNLLLRDIVNAFHEHFRSVRLNPRHFPSHPCLVSPDAELLYVRQVADVLIHHLLPDRETSSATMTGLLQETLACQVIKYCADRFCDPDYINQYVIYRCDLKKEAFVAAADVRDYSHARDYASFLRLINTCDSPERLRDIRYNIITEIMQAEHVHHIKSEAARSGGGAKMALAFVSDTEKGAHLSSRDLHRYINQLRLARSHCERRMNALGASDLVNGNQDKVFAIAIDSSFPAYLTISCPVILAPTVMSHPDLQHTLTSILSDGLALGYFTQHLQEQRSARSLQFYIMCRGIREVTFFPVRHVCI